MPFLYLNVQSATFSQSIWTFTYLLFASRSNRLYPRGLFGHPLVSWMLQSPFYCSVMNTLDFLLNFHRFKVQFTTFLQLFWTSNSLLSAPRSNLPLSRSRFGLSATFSLPQRPIHKIPAPAYSPNKQVLLFHLYLTDLHSFQCIDVRLRCNSGTVF